MKRVQRGRIGRLIVLGVVLGSVVRPALAGAHGEEVATGGGGGGPVTLTSEQRTTIGLATVAAEPRDIDRVLALNAFVAHDPDRHVFVNTRVDGRVEQIFVTLGERVERGQKLAVIQSRLLGNPPPSVTVASPIAGVVDDRLVALGETVEPNKTLFHVADLSEVIVQAEAYEEDIGMVALGLEARIRVFAYPEKTFSGRVTFLGQQLDPEKRTLAVWIRVANPDGRLKPGMFAKAALVIERRASVLAVPVEAILEAGGERFVFVESGDTITRVDVHAGAKDDRFVEISGGLVPGDRVVTTGIREVYTVWLTGGAREPD